MAKTKSSSGIKKSIASTKKRSGGSTARGTDQNSSTLPTEADARFIRSNLRPPPVTVRVIHTVTDAFTGRVCATLQRDEVESFFGTRLKPHQILKNAELAVEATAVARRFAHGAEIATQIAEPALVALMEQAALIVRDADELLAAHPELTDDLQDLTNWWTTTFPGGGPKAKVEGTTPAAAAASPVVKAATTG